MGGVNQFALDRCRFPQLRLSEMKFVLILSTVAWLGAASTFARNVNVQDAKMREFIRLLDEDGNGAVTLQEVKDKANQFDLMLGSQMGLPGMGFSYMAGIAVQGLDHNMDGSFSLADFGFLEQILRQGFNMALQLLDKDYDNSISQDEIVSFIDILPPSQFPMHVDPGTAALDTNMDLQISYEEAKNGFEEAAPLLIGALDRNDDGEVSQGEIAGGVRALVQQIIRVVDQDGDDKISPEELRNAANPDTLSNALMKFYDDNADGELRFEDLKSLESRYKEDPMSGVRHMASALSDAIKTGGNVE